MKTGTASIILTWIRKHFKKVGVAHFFLDFCKFLNFLKVSSLHGKPRYDKIKMTLIFVKGETPLCSKQN